VNGSLKKSTATCPIFLPLQVTLISMNIIEFIEHNYSMLDEYQNCDSFLNNPSYGHCYSTCYRNQNIFCQNLQRTNYDIIFHIQPDTKVTARDKHVLRTNQHLIDWKRTHCKYSRCMAK
jgi:hypothetical protein